VTNPPPKVGRSQPKIPLGRPPKEWPKKGQGIKEVLTKKESRKTSSGMLRRSGKNPKWDPCQGKKKVLTNHQKPIALTQPNGS